MTMVLEWTADADPSPAVWLVPRNEVENFLVVEELFQDLPVYIVNTKDIELCNLSQLYLSLKHYGDFDQTSVGIRSSSEYVTVKKILEAITCFNFFDSGGLSGAIQSLTKLTKGNDRYDKIVFLLEVVSAISHQMDQSFFHSIYGSLARRSWWLEIPEFSSKLQMLHDKVDELPSPFKEQFEKKYTDLGSIISLFSSKDLEKTFMILSAYCLCLSAHFLKKGFFYKSYLLIHRSLDLFFSSVAIKFNLILVKRDFLLYHNQIQQSSLGNGQIISLTKTYFDYLARLQPLRQKDEEALKKINKKRNSLLVTHGVEGINSTEVRDAYLDARRIMRDDKYWVSYSNNFISKIKLDPIDVFYELMDFGIILTKI